MKKHFIFPLAMLLLVLSSCQKEALETGTVPADAAQSRSSEVPFKSFCETTVQVLADNNGVLTLDIDGEGKATHLGKITTYSISTVNTNGFPWQQSGPMEFVAANGNQLFGTYSGIAVPGPEGISFEGTWEITSGTGNYEGVTGSGVYEGTSVFTGPANGIGEITYTGTLSGL
jgi:hypothetical protein